MKNNIELIDSELGETMTQYIVMIEHTRTLFENFLIILGIPKELCEIKGAK